MPGPGGRRLPASLLLATALALPAAAGAAEVPAPGEARRGLSRAEADLNEAEAAVLSTRADVQTLVARARLFPVEQRTLDADLFFESGDYEKAATLYRDLAENPEYLSHPGRDRALFQLGDSLYRMGAYGRAASVLREAAGPAGGRFRAAALARLFEAAVRTGDPASVADLELEAASPASPPEVRYAYGKWLHAQGKADGALEALGRVPPGSGPFARAQYVMGVVAAVRGDLLSAYGRFSAAAAVAPAGDEDRDVQGAAVLAKGRVLCAQDRLPECMSALQEIDPRSASFPEALFELTWAHFKARDLEGASRTVDILLMTSPAGDLSLKAHALKGRIRTRLDDTDGAEEAYREVSDAVGPVASELERLVADPRAMAAYFDFVLDRGGARQGAAAPVTERAAAWLAGDPGLASVVGIFEDLRLQRDGVREALEVARSLLWALRSGGRLDVFPALKERYLRLKEAEGRSLAAALLALRSVRGAVDPALPGDLAGRYRRAVAATDVAARALQGIPVTRDDYQARERGLTADLEVLGRDVFLVEALLEVQQQQVQAIQDWLGEQRFAREGPAVGPEREARFQAELLGHRAELAAVEALAASLKEDLARETLTLNTPETLQAEDARRRAALRAAQAEAQVLQDAFPGLPPSLAGEARQAAGLVERGGRVLSSVAPVVALLMDVAGRGARDMEASVLRESALLEQAAAEFQRAELDAQALASAEGLRMLSGVRDRLGEVLLEADLGLAEMAWQREERVSGQLRDLGRDFGDQMKAVEAVEKALREEEASLAPPAAPTGPAAPGPVAPPPPAVP